ncbi:MAG: TonB-dependent receptor [bacterium]|nr:TonB-dependent receptor [bacterium]
MKNCLELGAFVLLALANVVGAAQDREDFETIYGTEKTGGEQVTSLAAGYSQPIARAPAIATVVTAKEIEKLGATTVADVLKTLPGLHFSTARAVNDIFVIRGFFDEFNSYVLLLVNGIPVNNVVNGGRPQAWRMPVHNIARIEIMRGPGSALHGADAVAGVINIVTKGADEIGGTAVGAYGGSFETAGAWLQSGGRWENIEAAFSVEASTTGGYRKIIEADDQTRIDRLLGTRASLAPGPLNTRRDDVDARLDLKGEQWRLRAGYQGFTDVGTGAGITLALDPAGDFGVKLTNADFTYDLMRSESWDVSTQLSYLGTNNDGDLTPFPPGAFGGLFKNGVLDRFHFRVDETRGSITALFGGLPGHRLRFGAGMSHSRLSDIDESRNFRIGPGGIPVPTPFAEVEDLGDPPFLSEESRTLWYAMIQDEWVFAPDWILTAGIRLDHYSDFGSTVNPRLALVWNVSPTLTAKALYGRAFRAPTFGELYGNNVVAVAGNPDLEPAVANMVELSLDKTWNSRASGKAVLFGYDLDSQIVGGTENTANNPLAKIKKFNLLGRRGYGVELETDYRFADDLRFQASYAYYASDATDPNDLGRWSPKHQFYAAMDWRITQDWSLNGRLKWVSDRPFDFLGDGEHVWGTTSLRYDPPSGWAFSLTVDNLFDAKADEPAYGLPYGVPLPGRSVMAQVSWRLP